MENCFQHNQEVLSEPGKRPWGNSMSLHIYMDEIDFLCGLASVKSLSLFFPLLECVCLCSCRTLFYKIENIFPGCCKLLLNNVALSLAVVPRATWPGSDKWPIVEVHRAGWITMLSWEYGSLVHGWWKVWKCGSVMSSWRGQLCYD